MCIKKNKPIKHKLWGRLKKEAKEHYRIFPRHFSDYYEIKFWHEGHYEDYGCSTNLFRSNELEAAKKRVEEMRDRYFEILCNEALYERRRKRVSNL